MSKRTIRYEPGTFNPYSLVKVSLEAVFKSPTPEARPILNLAHRYLSDWEAMFRHHTSPYSSISEPVTSTERELVSESVGYLCRHIFALKDFPSEHAGFERQLQSEVARVADPMRFADQGPHQFAANALSMASTQCLFVIRDAEAHDAVAIVATAVLFSFVRYADWLEETGL
jgi:hypothetical protein